MKTNKNTNKKTRRATAQAAGAAIMAAAMLMAQGMPAMAAEGTNYGGTIGGTKTTTFDKYLLMDEAANVPNASFSYAVTAGEAKAYDVDGKKFEVLEGINPAGVTITDQDAAAEGSQLVFSPTDATSTDAAKPVKGLEAGKKYATETATLDFTACQFTEPGIYRYVITETGENQGITNDADLTRIVDVYVEDASDDTGKKLTIAGYVLHSNTDDAPDITMGDNNGSGGAYTATKSQGFTNTYDTSDLTFRKEVAGNQASHDKYFEFTVNITGAVPNTKYTVDVTTGADAISGTNAATIEANANKANVQELTTDADGNVKDAKFYLQHGQEIKIQGLAKGTQYAVTENKEDYKSEAAAITGYTDAANGTVVSTDLKTSYLNTRDGVIPTGVVMAVAPFAAVTLLGGIGAVTMVVKKKKDDDEE